MKFRFVCFVFALSLFSFGAHAAEKKGVSFSFGGELRSSYDSNAYSVGDQIFVNENGPQTEEFSSQGDLLNIIRPSGSLQYRTGRLTSQIGITPTFMFGVKGLNEEKNEGIRPQLSVDLPSSLTYKPANHQLAVLLLRLRFAKYTEIFSDKQDIFTTPSISIQTLGRYYTKLYPNSSLSFDFKLPLAMTLSQTSKAKETNQSIDAKDFDVVNISPELITEWAFLPRTALYNRISYNTQIYSADSITASFLTSQTNPAKTAEDYSSKEGRFENETLSTIPISLGIVGRLFLNTELKFETSYVLSSNKYLDDSESLPLSFFLGGKTYLSQISSIELNINRGVSNDPIFGYKQTDLFVGLGYSQVVSRQIAISTNLGVKMASFGDRFKKVPELNIISGKLDPSKATAIYKALPTEDKLDDSIGAIYKGDLGDRRTDLELSAGLAGNYKISRRIGLKFGVSYRTLTNDGYKLMSYNLDRAAFTSYEYSRLVSYVALTGAF